MQLHPCARCQRHVDVRDGACPFCGASVAAPQPHTHQRLGRVSRAAVFAGLTACWAGHDAPKPMPHDPVTPPVSDAASAAEGDVAALHGAVIDAQTRAPLANVTVELYNADARVAATTTDATGRFAFDDVVPNDYQLVARYSSADGAGSTQQPVMVRDKPVQLDITLYVHERVPVAKPYGAPPARRRVV